MTDLSPGPAAQSQSEEMIVNPHLEGGSFYWEAGPIGVLLIHGYTATTAEVRPLGKALHQEGYTVAGPLLPGHLSHPSQLNRVTWRDWTATTENAFEKLKINCQEVIVGGESLGGLLSLFLASEHPEIQAALLYAPVLKLRLSFLQSLQLSILARWIPYHRKSYSKPNPLWQGYPVNPLKGVLQLKQLQKVIFDRLDRVKQPLLIVQGKLDPTVHASVPLTIAERAASNQVEIHWMERSGHVVLLDQEREAVEELTLNFLHRLLANP